MDKRTQRQQKKRAKQKKSREAAQARRRGQSSKGAGGFSAAADWPLGECYASATWYEQGAHVIAAFTRTHPSGRTAVAWFEVDLAERGVVGVHTGVVPQAEQALGFIGQYTSDEEPVLESTPELVAKLVLAAAAHGRAGGHAQPSDLAEATSLFRGVDPEGCTHDILVGPKPPPPPKKKTLFAWLFGSWWE